MSQFRQFVAFIAAPQFRFSRQLRRLGLVAASGLMAASFAVPAQDAPDTVRWVSDNLSTYVRSGPTDGYRIVGTLSSGQRVELLETQGNYSRVRAEGGNPVWIPSSDLQQEPGPAERLPALEQQVADLSSELAGIDQNWQARVQGMEETLEARRALIEELEQVRNQLSAELTETQSELRSVQARLGQENQEMLMNYLVYGGGIAGAGLLAGLILPAVFKRRKRSDGWV